MYVVILFVFSGRNTYCGSAASLTCKYSYVANFKTNLCLEMVIYVVVYKKNSQKFSIKEKTVMFCDGKYFLWE